MLSMVQKYKFEQNLIHALLILFSLTVFTDANTFVGSESGRDWNETSSLARLSNIKRLWRDGKSGWWTNYLTEGLDKSRTLGGGRFSRRRFGSADISRDRKTNSFLSVTRSLWGGQDTFSPNGLDHCVEIGNHNPLCGFIRTGRRGGGARPITIWKKLLPLKCILWDFSSDSYHLWSEYQLDFCQGGGGSSTKFWWCSGWGEKRGKPPNLYLLIKEEREKTNEVKGGWSESNEVKYEKVVYEEKEGRGGRWFA